MVLRENLKVARESLSRVNQKIADLNFEESRRAAQAELDSTTTVTRNLVSEVNKLDAMIIRGHGHSELQAKEDAVKKQQQELDFQVSQLKPKLKDIGIDNFTAATLADAFDAKGASLSERQKECEELWQRQRDAKNAAASKKVQCDEDLAALRRKRNEEVETLRSCFPCLRKYRARQGQELKDFRRIYDDLKGKLESLRQQLSGAAEEKLLKAQILCKMFKDTHDKGQCRLCQRKIEPSDTKVISVLKKRQKAAEAIVAKQQAASGGASSSTELEHTLAVTQQDFDLLDKLKPAFTRLTQIESVDIPGREADLKKVKEALESADDNLSGASNALEQVQAEVRNVNSNTDRVNEISFRLKQLQEAVKDLEHSRLAESAVVADGSVSTEDLQQQREALQVQLQQARKTQSEAQEHLEGLRTKNEALQTESFKHQQDVLSLQEQLSAAEAGEKKKTANLKEIKEIDDKLKREEYAMADKLKARQNMEIKLKEFKAKASTKFKRDQDADNKMKYTSSRFKDKKNAAAAVPADSETELALLQDEKSSWERKRDDVAARIKQLSFDLDKKKRMLENTKSFQVRCVFCHDHISCVVISLCVSSMSRPP